MADSDHVPGLAGQSRWRGGRLARAEFGTRAVSFATAGRIAERELRGSRRRLARQEPWRVATCCRRPRQVSKASADPEPIRRGGCCVVRWLTTFPRQRISVVTDPG